MDVLDSLGTGPFHLDATAIAWVRRTRDALSTEDRLRQLFVHMTFGDDPTRTVDFARWKAGGIHRFVGDDLRAAWNATRKAVEVAEIPLFITGDIEGGGWSPPSMTRFTNQMGLAAVDDPGFTGKLVSAVAREARALGYNWTFTPVVDICVNPHSSVVGTRSYGSDVARILAHALRNVSAFQAAGIAATAKHWPGEGHDMRDQHLATTINPLSREDWEAGFGTLYRSLVGAGVMSVMSAHIAQPAIAGAYGATGLERLAPASLSPWLTTRLLRDDLGFNGLIVSDATPMAGFGAHMPRAQAVPACIAAGCDVLLFSNEPDRDLQFLIDGLRTGALTEERLNDAVTRILGMKAALGLHRMSVDELCPPFEVVDGLVRGGEAAVLAEEAARRSVTLVKDVQGLLPLNAARHRRIVVIDGGLRGEGFETDDIRLRTFRQMLTDRGFELRNHDPARRPCADDTDLVLYVMRQESGPALSRNFIDWQKTHGGFLPAMDRYWFDIPTLMVSFGHPFHLYDAPRVPAYVNAYTTTAEVQAAVVRKLTGNEPFEGKSPVDAFCGLEEARY